MLVMFGVALIFGFVCGYIIRGSEKSDQLLEGPVHSYAVIGLRSSTEALMITPTEVIEGETDVLLVRAAADRLVVTQVTPDRLQDVASRLCRKELSSKEISQINRFVEQYREDIIRQGIGELRYQLTALDARVDSL